MVKYKTIKAPEKVMDYLIDQLYLLTESKYLDVGEREDIEVALNSIEYVAEDEKNYFIYFDREIAQYGRWCFIDNMCGSFHVFDSKQEAEDYLNKYEVDQ